MQDNRGYIIKGKTHRILVTIQWSSHAYIDYYQCQYDKITNCYVRQVSSSLFFIYFSSLSDLLPSITSAPSYLIVTYYLFVPSAYPVLGYNVRDKKLFTIAAISIFPILPITYYLPLS